LKVFLALNPTLRQNLLVLFTAGLLFWSSLSAILPTLPLYIREIGGSSQAIGLVMGAFAIGLLASRSWLAGLADHRGRKIVLLIGVTAVAIAPLGYIVIDTIPLLISVRAFHGISIAAFALAYSALVVDLSPPQHRGELIGYMSLVNPVGMAIGPAVGGFLAEWFGFTPTFLMSAALGMLALGFAAQLQEPDQGGKLLSALSPSTNKFWTLLGTPRIRIPAIVLLLVGLAFGALSTFVPVFIQEVGVELNAGLFYTAAAIAAFSMRLVVGRASDRYGRGLFITISLVCYGLSMLLLWQAHTAIAFLTAAVVQGAGAGILIPMMAALMADRSYPNERGKTFSLCMVGFDAGIAIAGPVLGFIANSLGYRFIFGLSGSLVFLALIIFLTLSSKSLLHSFRFAIGRGRDVYAVEKLPFNSKSI
jgi:MFS family permease